MSEQPRKKGRLVVSLPVELLTRLDTFKTEKRSQVLLGGLLLRSASASAIIEAALQEYLDAHA